MSTQFSMADAWVQRFNEGAAHFNAGRLPEAENCFRQAMQQQPNHPTIVMNLGLTLRALNRPAEALEAFRTVLRLKRDHVDAIAQFAECFAAMGLGNEAYAVYKALLAATPTYPGGALSAGNLLMRMDMPEQAVIAYRNAVAADPGCATSTNNLGAALMSVLQEDEAAVVYRRALRMEPTSPEYHKNLGTCGLKRGDFSEGGREYEWREEQAAWKWKRVFPGKIRWDGAAPIDGRTFLVHFEQGIGDTFQFMRYTSVLKRRGARVIFECQKPLKRFLACAPDIDILVAHGEPLPDFDLHAPLMSLPYLCGSTPNTIPADTVPYLHAEPALIDQWRHRIEAGEAARGGREFRVGINWHANEVNRSIPLELFEPIARLTGVRLYSLQQVVGLDQLEKLRDRFGIIDWAAEMDVSTGGFVDTAAVMANMDLIISCDSAVNHLAGSMGLTSALAARWFGDWRWMRIPDTTPWYPTMRIFRMVRRNDWAEVMGRVCGHVAALRDARTSDGHHSGRTA